ncbi:RAxF-45 family protein [Polycladospora coralii]|nr:RAxF-45 family protein [Polycladospora coralii]
MRNSMDQGMVWNIVETRAITHAKKVNGIRVSFFSRAKSICYVT